MESNKQQNVEDDMTVQFICDKCNHPMYTIKELGYLGNPNLNNTECSPFTELMTLCPECTPIDYQMNKK